jgi:hypothetical protein
MALCLVYGKLHTNFEQLWYYKSKFENDYSIWCSNLLYIEILIYYDYNMHNLTIQKYL